MKTNIYLLLLACLHFTIVRATTHTVHVSDHQFIPAAFNCITGDTVLWVWDNGTHTTTTNAANIPAGAAVWDEPIDASNQSFQYVITVPGTYFYFSKLDGDMSASFTATGTLPVQLVNFNVTNTANNKALISWNTVTEQNTSYFSIQRSTDAIKFTEIAKLNAAGNTTTVKSYSYTDNNITTNMITCIIRLKLLIKTEETNFRNKDF
jgi:plastocyanin